MNELVDGRSELHVCVATGQNLANLIPCLQCVAKEVWILETPEMRPEASHLAAALKSRQIAVRRLAFPGEGVSAIRQRCEEIAFELDGRRVVINVTGGTKLMTLELVQTLAEHLGTGESSQAPAIVYTDTMHGRLDWLRPRPHSEPMRDLLTINDILLTQGYRILSGSSGADAAHWQRAAEDRADLTRELGSRAAKVGRFVGTLAGTAQRALNEPGGPFVATQNLPFEPRGDQASILETASRIGALSWDGMSQLVFRDKECAEYFAGGWVEEFAGAKISGLGVSDWVPRLKIQHVDRKTENELDAVLVHANRLLLVECKAARADDSRRTSDWIYKVSQLARQIGGSMATPLLLSARELDPASLERAAEYKVDVLDGARISTLSSYLRDWKKASA